MVLSDDASSVLGMIAVRKDEITYGSPPATSYLSGFRKSLEYQVYKGAAPTR